MKYLKDIGKMLLWVAGYIVYLVCISLVVGWLDSVMDTYDFVRVGVILFALFGVWIPLEKLFLWVWKKCKKKKESK